MARAVPAGYMGGVIGLLACAEPNSAYVHGVPDPQSVGLVAHYTFDEGSGREAHDSSGNENTGTLMGEPSWTTGRIGGALSFDGVDDRVVLGDPVNDSLDFGTGSFSYGLWVNVLAPMGSYDSPLSKGGSSVSAVGYDFELGTGGWLAGLSDGREVVTVRIAAAPILNRWVHLLVVVDRTAKLVVAYVDGLPVRGVSIATLGSVSSTLQAAVGATATSAKYGLKGFIDDVRLYHRALTASDVQELHSRAP